MDMQADNRGTFFLYADCFCVAGPVNSLIYDLGRKRFYSMPTAYARIVEESQGKSIEDVLSLAHDDETKEKLAALFDFLLERELGQIRRMPLSFPAIPTTFESPNSIQNAIIDFDEKVHDFSLFISQLDELGCEFLQIRSFSDLLSNDILEEITQACEGTSLRGIEFYVKFGEKFAHQSLVDFMLRHILVTRVIVHSSPFTEAMPVRFPGGTGPQREIYYTSTRLSSCNDCGRISKKTIAPPSPQTFFQLRNVNGCLYKKISVAADGSVRNCPALRTAYGALGQTSLRSITSRNEFRQVGNISKDKIEGCRDCEYRYACTDCRAFLNFPDQPYSKPAKCGYDPYTGKWADEPEANLK